MIRIENVETYPEAWNVAIRGMRNPMNSWSRSDSDFSKVFKLGQNDLDLCKKLINGGTEHRKFLRMIPISMDITAPLYWWKEFDTYKVGTVRNSCSTMHTLHKAPYTIRDFSFEFLEDDALECGLKVIGTLNNLRNKYMQSNEKECWNQLIELLPSSFNQKATVMLNYEVALNMLRQRSSHKLKEWHIFCDFLRGLPYMKEFEEAVIYGKDKCMD